ncbi:hypothetical protein AAE478_000224 [Parahypoxylon ruwenzoriense]
MIANVVKIDESVLRDKVENKAYHKLLPNQYSHTDVRSYIQELLLHPPPILDQVPNPNNGHITPPPALADEKNPILENQGHIVDIYSTGGTVSTPYTESSVVDIIYNEGPESLMKKARENLDRRDLDALKRKLKDSIYDQGGQGSRLSPGEYETLHGIDDNKECMNGVPDALKFRWVHLPVNEVKLPEFV